MFVCWHLWDCWTHDSLYLMVMHRLLPCKIGLNCERVGNHQRLNWWRLFLDLEYDNAIRGAWWLDTPCMQVMVMWSFLDLQVIVVCQTFCIENHHPVINNIGLKLCLLQQWTYSIMLLTLFLGFFLGRPGRFFPTSCRSFSQYLGIRPILGFRRPIFAAIYHHDKIYSVPTNTCIAFYHNL